MNVIAGSELNLGASNCYAMLGLTFTGIIMAAALFYTFLMIVQDTRETWNEYLEMGALYLGMFGACMCMILGTSVYQVHHE